MKEGTRLHKELEDEVHTTVQVDITTKEDAFGLRIWNLISGLRTIRETGLTRELEVWGLVDGNLVNGVIDGVSTENPDLEVAAEEPTPSGGAQPSITQFFSPKKGGQAPARKVYLTDVKTRGTTKPANTAQLRPAKVQLFLYHRFLSEMAAGKLDYYRIFRRYNLDPDEPFSDTFLAQMASLHDGEFFGQGFDSDDEYKLPASPTPTGKDTDVEKSDDGSDFIKYRSLRELVPLLESEVKQTFPDGAASIGDTLSVEYRFRRDGSLIDNRTFPMDDETLDQYLSGTLQWWKGEREPRGVQIEDAWKCMMCEFAEDCTWRKGLDEERLKVVRQRLQTKRKQSTG